MFDIYEQARARGYLDGLQGGGKNNRQLFAPDRLTAYDKGYSDGVRSQ